MGSTLNSALARCLLATLAMASSGSVLAQTDEIQVYDAGIAPVSPKPTELAIASVASRHRASAEFSVLPMETNAAEGNCGGSGVWSAASRGMPGKCIDAGYCRPAPAGPRNRRTWAL